MTEKLQRSKRLRKTLMDKKRKMWADLRDELFRKLGKDYSEQFEIPHDIEELSLMDVIEDTGIAVADIKRKQLEELDAALLKLDEGTYGLCSDCEAEIDEERLEAVPFALFCVKCASGHENRQ